MNQIMIEAYDLLYEAKLSALKAESFGWSLLPDLNTGHARMAIANARDAIAKLQEAVRLIELELKGGKE